MQDVNMENCHLYVLRYNYSGNYYVGSTTGDLNKRMKRHFQENCNKNTPCWSCKNKSSKGFEYYWYDVHDRDESHKNEDYATNKLQSIGDCCENVFTDEFMKEIEKITANKLDRKIFMYGGYLVKPPYPEVKSLKKEALEDEIYKEIHEYLIKEHELKTKKGEYYITLFKSDTWGDKKQIAAKIRTK